MAGRMGTLGSTSSQGDIGQPGIHYKVKVKPGSSGVVVRGDAWHHHAQGVVAWCGGM
jgi:hypothetical protein